MTVIVVTDTSSRLPAELRDEWAIREVPLHILLDGADLRDGLDEVPEDIHKRHATTAAATPAELCAAYQQALADSDGDGVVAVHISSGLSGTCRAAELTAADLGPGGAGHRFQIDCHGYRFRRVGRSARRVGRG